MNENTRLALDTCNTNKLLPLAVHNTVFTGVQLLRNAMFDNIMTKAEKFALLVVESFSIAVNLLGFVIILSTWMRIKKLWV